MKQPLGSALAMLVLSACARLEAPDVSQLAGAGPILAPSSGGIQLIDLGTLPGGWPSFAIGINASGVVVGYSYTGADYTGAQHAVRWTSSSGVWTVTDLAPQLTGSAMSAAAAINTGGDVVGWLRTASGADHAFLLTAAGAFVDLGTLPGMNVSYAQDVNVGGAVVGYSTQLPDPTGQSRRAFYYSSGAMVELPTLGQGSEASAIAADGTIVGHSYDGSGTEYAVRWTQDAGGTWTIAALPGGSNAAATAINASGNIVGGGCTNLTANGCAATRAYFWPAADHQPTVLGTLGGSVSFAQGMNDAGQIVGWSFSKTGIQHAFYAASPTSVLVDLGALGGKSAPSNATSLNGSKLVVGSSRVDTRPAQASAGTHATAWILP